MINNNELMICMLGLNLVFKYLYVDVIFNFLKKGI